MSSRGRAGDQDPHQKMIIKIPTNMLIFDQDDYVDHMGEGADDNHDNHDCVCPAKTSERSHNLNNNEDDEERKVKK